jgi:hypothetical protein
VARFKPEEERQFHGCSSLEALAQVRTSEAPPFEDQVKPKRVEAGKNHDEIH